MWPFLRFEQTTDSGPPLPTSAYLISMTLSMPASLIHACVSRKEREKEESLFLFLNHPRQENATSHMAAFTLQHYLGFSALLQ